MSSILKALKKVEGGHPKYIHVRSWPRGIDAKKAISNRARSAWFVNQLVTVLLVALVFIGVGYYLIEKKPFLVSKILADPALKRETPKPVIHREEAVREAQTRPVEVSPVDTDALSATAEKVVTAPDETELASEAVGNDKKTPDASDLKRTVPLLPPKFVEKPKSDSSNTPVEKPKSEKPKRKSSEPKQKVLAPADKSSLPNETSLPIENSAKPVSTETAEKTDDEMTPETPAEVPLQKAEAEKPGDDIGLTLQALVYSDDPESCFAVIDDVIVRKGGSIKGYTVLKIEKKQVVVSKNESEWTIKFK